MEAAGSMLEVAHDLYARANTTSDSSSSDSSSNDTRPTSYKIIGICLAIASGLFIGTSFVLKKKGLLKANDKYHEEAGEGYGYLKNVFWWSGMILMIIGEICNFVAYAFTDAILVTPLGALSVVMCTILSAIFLKERLSIVGKVACFLCIVGSVVIVLNAPQESSVADIQEMQTYVIAPGFLSYAGVIVVGAIATIIFVAPRYGKKNMLVYISICSWVGGLSVVATQGLGSAIVAAVQNTHGNQFTHWFLYVLFAFVVVTLLTEIIYLNKALNLFNAALVTPTYYVYFTSTTIITSAVLFQGFHGSVDSIITVVLGFLVICSGVVLLQLSKSAKDVPDAAVFKGDLDQIRTVAEQAQPESEPKADAIRGTAAIVRRFSTARQKMEVDEFNRLREDKSLDRLDAVSEDGQAEFEWDGLRRRRTTMISQRSRDTRSRSGTVLSGRSVTFTEPPPTPHPPLGMSYFPTPEELEEQERQRRQTSPSILSSIAGTIRGQRRSTLLPGGHHSGYHQPDSGSNRNAQSPMHPVQLTDIAIPSHKLGAEASPYGTPAREHAFGLPDSLQRGPTIVPTIAHPNIEYEGAAGHAARIANNASQSNDFSSASASRHIQFHDGPPPPASRTDRNRDNSISSASLAPPTPPPHRDQNTSTGGSARRQFSFQNMFRRHQADHDVPQDHHHPARQTSTVSSHLRPTTRDRPSSRVFGGPQVHNASEEERLGLVVARESPPRGPSKLEDEDEDDYDYVDGEEEDSYEDEVESASGSAGNGSEPGAGVGRPQLQTNNYSYTEYTRQRQGREGRDGSGGGSFG